MEDWSDLQHDILEAVAQHLIKIEDYVNFGAVCTSWGAASSNQRKNFKGLRLWQQIPCLMLSPDDNNKNDIDRELYSLMDNEIVAKVSLPQIKGRKCFESLGWLGTVGEQGDMSLFNPFTGTEIPLPHQNTFPEYDRYETEPFEFVMKVVLSCRPDESSDFAVMIICGSVGFLAFWRPGDPSWNRIDTRNAPYCDVIYYKDQFYGIDYKGYVVVCDIKGPNPTEAKIITRFCNIETVTDDKKNELVDYKNVYLVEPPQSQKCSSEGKLLIVTRDGTFPDFVEDDSSTDFVDDDGAGSRIIYGTTGFRVYELDLIGQTWKVMETLGNTTIFVGHSASISLEISPKLAPKIKPNHIYFTDDCWEAYCHLQEGSLLPSSGGRGLQMIVGKLIAIFRREAYCHLPEGGKDMGIYSMETGSIVPFFHGRQRLSSVSPSIWITTHF